jgi:hypothetical protein
MNESERSSSPVTPESVWKSLDGKEADMDIAFTPNQLCAMARSRERLNIWGRRILLILLILFAGVLAYNVFSVSQLWLRLSMGWYLAWTFLLVWGALRERPRHMSATESCTSFLRREFEAKRSGLLATRRYMFLVLTPPVLASWWGGGWRAVRLNHWNLRAVGVDPSSQLYKFAGGPWPFVIMGILLVLDWLAFGLAAKKATRELEELRRRTQA